MASKSELQSATDIVNDAMESFGIAVEDDGGRLTFRSGNRLYGVSVEEM